jgi:hypothetical protein
MWHISLISFLAKKLCKTESDQATLFVQIFFNQFIESVDTLNDGLMVMAFIGITNDLVKAVHEYSDKSLSANQFARLLVGLTIIHYKYICDTRVYLSTIMPVLSHPTVLKTLGISVLATNDPRVHSKNMINHLRMIENGVFRWLKYHVKIEIPEFVSSLNYLLNQLNNQHEIITDLIQSLAELEGESEELDLLLYSLRRHQAMFFTPLKSQSTTIECSDHCIADDVTYVIQLDETEDDKMVLDTHKKINVNIKLWLDFEWNDLCEHIAGLLEVNRNTLQTNDHSLFKCQSKTLSMELTKLIERIRSGEYDCVDSILLKLTDLQSRHRSAALEKMITLLENEYRSSRYLINPDNITTITSLSPIVN